MNIVLEKPTDTEILVAGEPAWLSLLREQGKAQFESLPAPSAQDERWRFASVNRLKTDGFAPTAAPGNEKLENIIERSNLISRRSGQLVFTNDSQSYFEGISPELRQKGVIYLPLSHAIEQHPELMQRFFLKESTELGSEKYFGLHAQYVKAGSVIYIPKGVEIEQPFVNYYWTHGENAAVFPHTLIIAAENSKVNIVDIFFSDTDENEALNVSVANIHAADGANVMRKVIQNWNEKTTSFQLDTTVAGRNATVKNLAVNIGAERARYENQSRIEGPGADVKMYSLTVAEETQEFDQRTFQTHKAESAVSDLLYKNALLDNARTIFSGLIKVAENAQQTDAYQTNRNLLLDPTAEANTLPGLEILANNVKCSHGATTGNVDPEELFYMMQRGISRREAMKLMVFGFFEEVIEKIDNEELAEGLRNLIHNKFDSKIK